MTREEYLEAEFRRYFPDADSITPHFHDADESIEVLVRSMGNSHVRDFHMDTGSDDDCFRFTNSASGQVVTIPLMLTEEPDGITWGELSNIINDTTRVGLPIELDEMIRATIDEDPTSPWYFIKGLDRDDKGFYLTLEEYNP